MDLWRQEIGKDGAAIGEPEPLTAGVGMRTAVFSADGTKLAYSRGRQVGNLWRVPIRPDRLTNWSDAQQLTFDEAHVEFADVSPDGTRVALSSDRGGNPDLWLMPAGGGELQQLTTDPEPDWAPAFSPDGSRIAFYASRSGNRDLWVMLTLCQRSDAKMDIYNEMRGPMNPQVAKIQAAAKQLATRFPLNDLPLKKCPNAPRG